MKVPSWMAILIPPPSRKMVVCALHNRIEWLAVAMEKQKMRLAHPVVQVEDHDWTPAQTASFIENTRRRHKLSYHEVELGWPIMQGVWVRLLRLPEMPDDEVMSSIRWTMAEEADFSLDEATCVWTRIPSEGQESFIVAYAVKTDVMTEWVAALRHHDLEPVLIGIPACHYPVMLSSSRPQMYAILETTERISHLYIYFKDVLCFVREIPIVMSQFEDALMEVLISERGKIELTRDQARLVRNECGVPMDQGPTSVEGLSKKHVMSLIRPLLETLVREISFSLDYFVAITEQSAPQQLYLLSQEGRMRNLDVYLAEQLGMEVAYLSVPDAWRPKEGPLHEDPTRFGLLPYQALAMVVSPPTKKIDLLPASLMTYYRHKLERIVLHVIMVTLPVFILVSHWLVKLQWEDYENRKRLAVIQDNNLDLFRSLHQEIQTKKAIVNTVRQGYVPMDMFLKFLSSTTPDEVTLDALTVDIPSKTVTLKGRARLRRAGQSVLPDYVGRLEDSVFFDEVYLISSNTRSGVEAFVIKGELPDEL